MIDYIGASYTETNTKLSWPIGSGANCDENQIGQHIIDHIDAIYIENRA